MYDVVQEGLEPRVGPKSWLKHVAWGQVYYDRVCVVEELGKAEMMVYRAHDDHIELQYR